MRIIILIVVFIFAGAGAAQTAELKIQAQAIGAGLTGSQGIVWGRKLADIEGLKYFATDPANGADIYVLADALAATADVKKQTRYYFWNGELFRLHLPVNDKEEWLALRQRSLDRWGQGYHLAGEKDVQQWDSGDTVFILRFDTAPQKGYFEAESKQIAAEVSPRDSSGVQTLISALQDKSSDTRVRAATSLGMMKDERATMPLVYLLKDQDFIVRYNVALALGEIKDGRAVVPLIQALADEDALVRSFAAEALGNIGDRRAIEPLINHLGDNDSAAPALEKLTGQRLGAEGERWQQWWQKQRDFPGIKQVL